MLELTDANSIVDESDFEVSPAGKCLNPVLSKTDGAFTYVPIYCQDQNLVDHLHFAGIINFDFYVQQQ